MWKLTSLSLRVSSLAAGLGAPEITPDLKRDLRLLKLRGAFDPKRFYKTNDTSKLPTHFAVGGGGLCMPAGCLLSCC